MWSQLAASLQHGNGYLITMMVLAFIGTVILFERFIMLQLVYHIDFKKFLGNLKKTVQAEDFDRAINICKSASQTSLPHICLKALEAAERDPTTVRGTIEEETIDFLPRIESRLPFLPALATLILLVGILATLDALWGAFDSIAVLDTAEKQARLANGIAGSLNPTAFGLIACMLFVAGHQLLKGIAVRLVERVHHGVTVLSNLLVPQEFATYAPAAAMAGDAYGASDLSAPMNESIPTQQQEAEDESFDDASVEDIKDEEEII